ncbi:DUF928 domain-containing protein [Phormidesmis sp. 146-35]
MLKIITVFQKKLILIVLILATIFLSGSGEASQESNKKLFASNLRVGKLSEIRFYSPAEQASFLAQQNRRTWNPPKGKQPSSQSIWSRLKGLIRRGTCRNLESPLTVLLPLTQKTSQGFKDSFGLTVTNYPTFWIYVPQLPSEIKIAEFKIQDQDGNDFLAEPILVDLFGTTLPTNSSADFKQPFRIVLPRTLQTETHPHIIGISLPPEVKSLSFGEFYHWYLSIICDSRRPSRNPNVDGWIGVIQPDLDLENEIAKVGNDLERSRIYAREGIWHDTLTTLAILRCKELQNPIFASEWSSLLRDESVRLNEIADKSTSIEKCEFPSEQLSRASKP